MYMDKCLKELFKAFVIFYIGYLVFVFISMFLVR